MKKTLLSVVCLVAMAAAGAGTYSAHQQSQIDPLLLENVEALSSPESGGGDGVYFIFDYKNKWGGLFAGCKYKPGHTCTVKNPGWPDIL